MATMTRFKRGMAVTVKPAYGEGRGEVLSAFDGTVLVRFITLKGFYYVVFPPETLEPYRAFTV